MGTGQLGEAAIWKSLDNNETGRHDSLNNYLIDWSTYWLITQPKELPSDLVTNSWMHAIKKVATNGVSIIILAKANQPTERPTNLPT